MTQLVQYVVELQQVVTDLRAAETQLSGIPDWMKELHQEHEAYKAEIAALEEAAAAAASDRRQAETAIADVQERLKRYQEQINSVATQREYGALLQEIDAAKTLISQLEEQGLSSLERREQAEKELADKRAGFQDLAQRYETELAKWEQEKPGIAQQVEVLSKRLKDLRELLPRGALTQFDRLLDRTAGQAVAAVRKLQRVGKGPDIWHCDVCNYRVRPQTVVEIGATGGLNFCESCKRILYLPSED